MEKKSIRLIPLWNSIVFSNDKGTPYHSRALIRRGVLTVGGIALGRAADPEKLAVIAPTWRDFYRRRIDWLLAKEEMAMEATLGGSQLPPLRQMETGGSSESSSAGKWDGRPASEHMAQASGHGTASTDSTTPEADALEKDASTSAPDETRDINLRQMPPMREHRGP